MCADISFLCSDVPLSFSTTFCFIFTTFLSFPFHFSLPFHIQRICFACLPKFLIFMPTQLSWQACRTCIFIHIYLYVRGKIATINEALKHGEYEMERNASDRRQLQNLFIYICIFICSHITVSLHPAGNWQPNQNIVFNLKWKLTKITTQNLCYWNKVTP